MTRKKEHRTVSVLQNEDLSRHLLRVLAQPAKRLLQHPATTLLLGIGLFLVGMIEMLEGIFEHFETGVEYYHGFLLFGFVTVLRGLMELLEASEFFSLNETEFEQEAGRAAQSNDPPTGGSA